MTNALQSDKQKLAEQINQSLQSGDEFLFSKLQRSKAELDQKIYFRELADRRERLKELAADRDTAQMVRDDLQNDLRASGAIVSGIREKLEAAESEHRELTAKLYYLDSTIDGNRKAIGEVERDIQRMIESKIVEVTQ